MRETEDVIDSLVRDLKPVPRHALERRFALAILPALAISLLLMLVVVGLRTDMAQALMLPVFWIKSAYNALLAIAAFAAVYRLYRPDGSEGRFFGVAAAIVLALAVMAVIQLALSLSRKLPRAGARLLRPALPAADLCLCHADPDRKYLGAAWRRAEQPRGDRLHRRHCRLSASGAWVYSWFCTENGLPFVTLWYSLGILLTGAIGALLGPRLLRW